MSILFGIKNLTLNYKKSFVTHKDIGQIYDKLSKTHSSSKSSGFLETYKKIYSFTKIGKNSKILEIGCGDGIFSTLIEDDVNYFGVDISSKMIDEALKKNKRNRKNVIFEKVDAAEFIKYSSPASYDAVVFSFSWKYFDDVFKRKIFEILKENGTVIIIDDFCDNYSQLFTEYENFKRENLKSVVKINNFNNYINNTEEINSQLNEIGYLQNIFLKFEKVIKTDEDYLINSGLVPELISEFGNSSELYIKKFVDYLMKRNFALPQQKYYICMGKK